VLSVVVTAIAAGFLIFAFGGNVYLWVKAFHVIAVIAWMAGMLYLPRLFVYHADTEPGTPQSETFKVMERRLLRAIINPAMIVAWVFGLWLVWNGGWLSAGWFHVKLAAVIVLSGLHGYFSSAVRAFGEDRNKKSSKYWRLMNEIPTLLLIVIVVMVIVKPF
jgi:putative membrane protein